MVRIGGDLTLVGVRIGSYLTLPAPPGALRLAPPYHRLYDGDAATCGAATLMTTPWTRYALAGRSCYDTD